MGVCAAALARGLGSEQLVAPGGWGVVRGRGKGCSYWLTGYLVAQCGELSALALRLRARAGELARHLPKALHQNLAVGAALHGRHLRLLRHRLDLGARLLRYPLEAVGPRLLLAVGRLLLPLLPCSVLAVTVERSHL